MPRPLAEFLSLLTLGMLGCNPAVPVTAPSPSPDVSSPRPIVSPGTLGQERLPITHLPPREEAVFGAIEALRQTDNELTLAYRVGESPFTQRFGLAGTMHLTLGGREYAVHWDSATQFKQMKVGDTVNLHPTDMVVCIDRGRDFPDCYRLMRAFKGTKRVPPLIPY